MRKGRVLFLGLVIFLGIVALALGAPEAAWNTSHAQGATVPTPEPVGGQTVPLQVPGLAVLGLAFVVVLGAAVGGGVLWKRSSSGR